MRDMSRSVELVVIATVSVALFAPGLPARAAHDTPHWSYSGSTGPTHWSALEHDYSSCGIGGTQSPIDIRDEDVRKSDLPTIEFRYKPSPLRIIDNGHTIQVNYPPGSFIKVGDKDYELLQFHFHKPSEEEVNGRSYDMVAHLVHRDSAGHLAVVAVLLEAGHEENALLRTLWNNLPKTKEAERTVQGVSIDASDLLPASHAYYTFAGSLTTPPCSEGVTWFVLQHPTGVSNDEVARFGKLYPRNARPVQPLNGREISAGA